MKIMYRSTLFIFQVQNGTSQNHLSIRAENPKIQNTGFSYINHLASEVILITLQEITLNSSNLQTFANINTSFSTRFIASHEAFCGAS